MRTILVKKIGEKREWCREYFQNLENGNIYAKYEGEEQFYSCSHNGGEPDSPLKEDINVQIVEKNEKGSIRVGKHIEGITLNPLEYLLDDNGGIRYFNTHLEAEEFLKKHGFTEEHLDNLVFEDVKHDGIDQ